MQKASYLEPLWYKNMDFLLTFLNNYTWWCNRIFEEEGLYYCAAIWRMARKACLVEPRRGQRLYFMYIITRVKMATARSLCKVCRSFLSTNVILQSQTGQRSAKVNSAVGLEFGRCFINVFWFSLCDLFRPQAILKNQHRQLIEWHI